MTVCDCRGRIEQYMSAEQVIQGIKTANRNGVNLFICGVIHNYSLETRAEGSIVYRPHPRAKGYLTGKKIISESQLIRETKPGVILLESYTPSQEKLSIPFFSMN